MKTKGLSLLELLIAMAIVGILAAIAYPGYQEYVTRTRRTDGQAALMDLASRMERYYSEENTYQTATIGTGNNTDVKANAASPEGFYTLAITASGANSYTLQATPTGTQGTVDTKCQSLTLNNLGQKGVTNGPAGAPTGVATECW